MDAVNFSQIRRVFALVKRLLQANNIQDIQYTTDIIGPGNSVLLRLPIAPDISKMMLKVVWVQAESQNAAIDLEIRSSQATDAFLVYKNVVDKPEVYDLVDLPYIDDERQGNLHVWLKNNGTEASTFKLRIIGVSTIQ